MTLIKEMYGALRIFNNDGKKRMAVLDGHRIFLDEVANYDCRCPKILHQQIISPNELVEYIRQHKSKVEVELGSCFLGECGMVVYYVGGAVEEIGAVEYDNGPNTLSEEAARHDLNQRLNKFFHGDQQ